MNENHLWAIAVIVLLMAIVLNAKSDPCSAWSDGQCNSDMRPDMEGR